jgi:hydroxymethyl cephem carbamoyltransferase
MLILAIKPGHDGAIAAIQDNELLFSIEGEKNSFPRYASITPTTFVRATERLDRLPDIVAFGGWHRLGVLGHKALEADYFGIDAGIASANTLFGAPTRLFSSSHERSHIMMAVGMAQDDGQDLEAVLVWEGVIGAFYLLSRKAQVVKTVRVLTEPGSRYAFLFALADPGFPDNGSSPDVADSGKLMALSSFATATDADARIRDTVDQVLSLPTVHPAPKSAFRQSPVYNAGVESVTTKLAGAFMSARIFEIFARAAEAALPRGMPLRISGGCGLNCQWNERWRQHGFFHSVFVPPCTNDSGSAIGTAIDALSTLTDDYRVRWDVYSGLDFEHDVEPPPALWLKQALDRRLLAASLAQGDLVAWVQGRWEMGPRALGNRSILGEPFNTRTRDRLNTVKKRESYRPIAPCCRMEDVDRLFESSFDDPYMLYARKVRASHLRAVTHVDGTARLQTVTERSNRPLHQLLSAFAEGTGAGVLCNTSLNFQGLGFINRVSDLVAFCEASGIGHMVIGDAWFRHV